MALRRLDSVISAGLPVAFIKIDAEGAEFEVLQGAQELLRRCRRIVYIECGKLHHTHNQTTPRPVLDLFAACGMGVFLLDRTRLSQEALEQVHEASYRSGYDRTTWGNHWAMPAAPD